MSEIKNNNLKSITEKINKPKAGLESTNEID